MKNIKQKECLLLVAGGRYSSKSAQSAGLVLLLKTVVSYLFGQWKKKREAKRKLFEEELAREQALLEGGC